ncbi:MAG: hypothetical protein HY719_15375 [Planctomycetes bacterium]|nr:hypothetical protein [Planctomycetota bacterium]
MRAAFLSSRGLRVGAALAALLVVGATGRASAQQVPGQDPSKSFADLVETAIDKGVAWLKKKQQPAGHFGITKGNTYAGGTNAYPNIIGNTAFALYTLLKCGVPKNDPVIVKGFEYIRKHYGDHMQSSYEISACLFAFEELSTHKPPKRKEEKEFEYKKRAAKEAKVQVAPGDLSLVKSMLQDLIGTMNFELGAGVTGVEGKGWRYGNNQYAQVKAQAAAQGGGTVNIQSFDNTGGNMDVSATQYALLGLKSASRMGLRENIDKVYATRPDVKAGASIFFDVMTFLLSVQEADGPAVTPKNEEKDQRRTFVPGATDKARGWSYMKWMVRQPQESTASGSMTTAGVCGLILCKSELQSHPLYRVNKDLPRKVDQAIRDGIAWLALNYTMERNPYVAAGGAAAGGANLAAGIKGNHYYYLYGMERMGVFGDIDKIDKNDWYTDGATVLLREQKKANDAEWFWDSGQTHTPADEYDTCFALLFLEKASVPLPGVFEVTRGPGK